MGIKSFAASSIVAAFVLVCGFSEASSAPYWVYDGTSYARVTWGDFTSTEDPGSYTSFSAPAGCDSVVSFGDAHARSELYAASTNTLAAGQVLGLPADHRNFTSARANNELNGLASGLYNISFSYSTSPDQDSPLLPSHGEVGYEWSGGSRSFSGSGMFSEQVYLESNPIVGAWVAFYATSNSAALFNGSSESNARIFDILVVPAAGLPAPVPGALWLLGPGLAGVAFMRRRLTR